MNGQGYSIEVREEDGRIELHVLARAYRDAWFALRRQAPVGRHRLGELGVTIEYEKPGRG